MADDEHNQEQEAVDAKRKRVEQYWEQHRLEEERLEQERLDSAAKRLEQATTEQIKLGPKGLHPNVEFDFARWQRNAKGYRQGICEYSDLLILAWCRIYLSVVQVSSDTVLIHYSFENLYHGNLPLNL